MHGQEQEKYLPGMLIQGVIRHSRNLPWYKQWFASEDERYDLQYVTPKDQPLRVLEQFSYTNDFGRTFLLLEGNCQLCIDNAKVIEGKLSYFAYQVPVLGTVLSLVMQHIQTEGE